MSSRYASAASRPAPAPPAPARVYPDSRYGKYIANQQQVPPANVQPSNVDAGKLDDLEKLLDADLDQYFNKDNKQ